jgi:two-component system response regulator ChvI
MTFDPQRPDGKPDRRSASSPFKQEEAPLEPDNEGLVSQDASIALVDDDVLFRESVEQNLLDSGFSVSAFSDGPTFLSALETGLPIYMVVLDWKMPEMNGIEVLRRLRRVRADLPVIFLTVLGEQIYEEAALQGGAVDFVEKSRSFSILKRRIELIYRGQRGSQATPPSGSLGLRRSQTVDIGLLKLDMDSHRAEWRQCAVVLSVTEFKIVRLLAERMGRDVSYRDIYDLVHGVGFHAGEGSDGFRTNVRAFMKRIRQKFRDVDPRFDGIQNYPGFGYRWTGDETSDAGS